MNAKFRLLRSIAGARQRLRDFRWDMGRTLAQKYTRAACDRLPVHKCDGRPRVTWVLSGDEWVGSARLKGILIDRHARQTDCGFDSVVAYMPQGWDRCLRWSPVQWRPFLMRTDVLVIQTRTGATRALLDECRRQDIAVVLTVSDMEFEEIPARVTEIADAIVVSSEPLQTAASEFHHNVTLIDDPVEVPDGSIRASDDFGSQPELVWLGHSNNWPTIEWLKKALDGPEFSRIRIRTVTSHPIATHQWSPVTVWRDVSHSAIAVIPCKLDDYGRAKSSNRLAAFMAMGYPVICTPIPSYTRLIKDGVNGFFATTAEEWRHCISTLRDPELRERVGTAARHTSALDELRIDNVAARWRSLFESLR